MNDTLNVLLTLRGIEQVINANCSFQEMFLKLVVLARFKACLALSIGSEIPETNVASVLRALGFSFILSFSVMGATGLGQAQTVSDPNGFALPSTAQTSDVSPASASISGVVLDPSGAVVRGATIRVTGANVATERTAVADDQGRFTFSDLPVGIFKVTVASGTGLTTFTSDAVTLAAGQKLELPPITLRITVASSDVHVVGAATTQEEVAQAQIQAQEKQRVLGIIPNFYSSYIWNAAPMASKQKFGLALRSTTDPVAFMVAGGVAGVEQWHHTFPGYGRGSEGYLKRYGAAFGQPY